MHWIDWLIIALMLMGLVIIAHQSQRLTRSVADFLAANRAAGRYLLTMASGMAGLGAISIVSSFEKFYEAGFAGIWWAQISAPVGLVLALSGFVVYRFRETRALTLAQFLERRYSRRFRIFMGIVAWISGILNYGIFPLITSRFLIYFTGLPNTLQLFGVTIPTVAVVMPVMLGLALYLVMSGGQVAVMITDFFQGQLVNIVMLIVLAVLIFEVSWPEIVTGLQKAPVGQSRINPFEQGNVPDFNVWFFVMMAALQIMTYRAWQGSQAYNSAPKSPHEARMATILAEFRGMVTYLLVLLLPIIAYAILHLPQYAGEQQRVAEVLATMADEQGQKQMLVPVTLATMLPVGVMGLFAAIVMAAAISTDDTYLHSWGAIFIQDVVMPFRSQPLSTRAHLRLLRVSMVGVAVFGYIWSLTFPLNEYILMYFQITAAVYLGGAGAVLIGGLYWSRGTVEGAWAAMISGSILAVCGIVSANIIWPKLFGRSFPINGMTMSFLTAIIAVLIYVIVSLLSGRRPIDMDRLLHRGKYQIENEGHKPLTLAATLTGPSGRSIRDCLWRWLNVGPEFTVGDKIIYMLKLGWVSFFFIVFLIGTIAVQLNTVQLNDDDWVRWWSFQIGLTAIVAVITVVWFLIGGFKDLIQLVRELRSVRRDETDDGTVRAEEHLQEAD